MNEYLRWITSQDFTAKDFRTWAGTTLAAAALTALGTAASVTQAKKNIVAVIKSVSQKLGNRPPACRKYYVHPAILDLYAQGGLCPAMEQCLNGHPHGRRREELAVIKLLKSYERAAKRK